MVRVKICGITSAEEARLAERCGADAIGILVGRHHTSDDFVDADTALEIRRCLSPFTTSVLVTHLENPEAIVDLAERIACHVVQLHSDLPADALAAIGRRLRPRKVLGKIGITDERDSLRRAEQIATVVDAVVLDSIDPATDRVGGTGIVHDWSISARIRDAISTPVVLAGGLTPENVAAAIAAVRPWAVDVNSGVEDPNGKKSAERLRSLVRMARSVGGSRSGTPLDSER